MTTPTGEAPKRRGERTDNSVKKLPNGKGWRARPTLGTDPVTGKQVRPTKVFATKKAAQDWVTDHWLTLRAADPSIGPNTVRADRESLAYARKAFGAVPVQKLTPAALADWSAKLTGKDGKVLAPATKRRAIVRVKSVMVHARKMRWLTYHPAADLDSPEQRRSSRPRPTTAAQRTAAGLEAITLGKLRHSNVSRMRGGHRRRCGCRLARPYRAHDPGRLWARDRRPPDRSRGRLLRTGRTDLGHKV